MLTNILPIILSIPELSGDAYLDPGSGSYILQILIAAVLGSMFFLRSFWGKVLNRFRKVTKSETAPEEQPAEIEASQQDNSQDQQL